jgi:hypothetical protein
MRPVLLNAVPILLIASSLLAAHGAASQGATASLRLADLTRSWAQWADLGWLVITQPVALVLWLACAPTGGQRRLSWRWIALDRDLVATALLLGGWHGPFVDRLPILGLLYTAIKVAALAAIHAWIAASVPPADSRRHAQRVWVICVPLSALILLFTVASVVLR